MFNKNFAECFDPMNSGKDYKKEIRFVYNWAGRPKSILDIGCGTANYWKHLPKKVFMGGIERSPDMASHSEFKDRILCADITRCTFSKKRHYDCVTALFDVMNYIPRHEWWKRLPVKKGGYFVFDIWNKEKVDRDGFRSTIREAGNVERYIRPMSYDGHIVKLKIYLTGYHDREFFDVERHTMYVWSEREIRRFAGRYFKVVEIKKTKRWQTFYKLRRL
jgi:SAM-dependent methyltransferase